MRRYSHFKKSAGIAAVLIILIMTTAFPAFAASSYTDPDTGYAVIINDEAGLIDEADMPRIESAMKNITAYGNAGFYTTDYNSSSTEALAKSAYRSWFGTNSGVLFVIDMDNRNIWIWANGAANRVINKEWADIITDNTYTYAKKGLYADCAEETFKQIGARLQGEKVNNPLKIGTSALLSVLISLAAIIIVLMRLNKKKQNPDMLLPLAGAASTFAIANTAKNHLRTTKTHTPRSSGGGHIGGGGGSFGGGGGFGGGGSGGGHGF